MSASLPPHLRERRETRSRSLAPESVGRMDNARLALVKPAEERDQLDLSLIGELVENIEFFARCDAEVQCIFFFCFCFVFFGRITFFFFFPFFALGIFFHHDHPLLFYLYLVYAGWMTVLYMCEEMHFVTMHFVVYLGIARLEF